MSHIEQQSSSSDSEPDDEDDILIKQLAREVEQQLITSQPVTKSISYAVINTVDRSIIEGLFTTRAAAYAHMIRLAVNREMTYYPEYERMNDKAAVLTQGGFLNSVSQSIPECFKIVILDHLDITQPVYVITTNTKKMIYYPGIIKSLTNSLEALQEVIDTAKNDILSNALKQWFNDGRWLKYCTLNINPELPKLKPN